LYKKTGRKELRKRFIQLLNVVCFVGFYRFGKMMKLGGRIEAGNKKQLNKLFVGILRCCFLVDED
jgi:hypothetical protein